MIIRAPIASLGISFAPSSGTSANALKFLLDGMPETSGPFTMSVLGERHLRMRYSPSAEPFNGFVIVDDLADVSTVADYVFTVKASKIIADDPDCVHTLLSATPPEADFGSQNTSSKFEHLVILKNNSGGVQSAGLYFSAIDGPPVPANVTYSLRNGAVKSSGGTDTVSFAAGEVVPLRIFFDQLPAGFYYFFISINCGGDIRRIPVFGEIIDPPPPSCDPNASPDDAPDTTIAELDFGPMTSGENKALFATLSFADGCDGIMHLDHLPGPPFDVSPGDSLAIITSPVTLQVSCTMPTVDQAPSLSFTEHLVYSHGGVVVDWTLFARRPIPCELMADPPDSVDPMIAELDFGALAQGESHEIAVNMAFIGDCEGSYVLHHALAPPFFLTEGVDPTIDGGKVPKAVSFAMPPVVDDPATLFTEHLIYTRGGKTVDWTLAASRPSPCGLTPEPHDIPDPAIPELNFGHLVEGETKILDAVILSQGDCSGLALDHPLELPFMLAEEEKSIIAGGQVWRQSRKTITLTMPLHAGNPATEFHERLIYRSGSYSIDWTLFARRHIACEVMPQPLDSPDATFAELNFGCLDEGESCVASIHLASSGDCDGPYVLDHALTPPFLLKEVDPTLLAEEEVGHMLKLVVFTMPSVVAEPASLFTEHLIYRRGGKTVDWTLLAQRSAPCVLINVLPHDNPDPAVVELDFGLLEEGERQQINVAVVFAGHGGYCPEPRSWIWAGDLYDPGKATLSKNGPWELVFESDPSISNVCHPPSRRDLPRVLKGILFTMPSAATDPSSTFSMRLVYTIGGNVIDWTLRATRKT